MACVDDDTVDVSDYWQMTCMQLRSILRSNGQKTSGNKSVLVARCYDIYYQRIKSIDNVAPGGKVSDKDPLCDLSAKQTITYEDIYLTAKGRQWNNDLRLFPQTNMNHVTKYLSRTRLYGSESVTGFVNKKMKSRKFFQEGNISSYEIAKGFGTTWVKAKVIASMRSLNYKVIASFNSSAEVTYAACECPAGLGVKGAGKCNHVGGLLFAIVDFNKKELSNKSEKVTCTSKLNEWIVPRNQNVDPKPISDIKFSQKKNHNKSSSYDPRAPCDRTLDAYKFQQLYSSLRKYVPNSAFFLYHEPLNQEQDTQSADYMDSMMGTDVAYNVSVYADYVHNDTESHQIDIAPDSEIPKVPVIKKLDISDSVQIDENFISKYVDPAVDMENITQDKIQHIEEFTRDQSENNLWNELHKVKITASSFGKVCKCKKNPDAVIKALMYSDLDRSVNKALQYGKVHESDAVAAYVKFQQDSKEKVIVKKTGLLFSLERPSYGASLDGLVCDADTEKVIGGLECKCPISKAGLTVSEASSDNKFYLRQCENGTVQLKRNHDYYVQLQGQLYVSGLEWVDFVVWFGSDEIFVEKIFFDKEQWYNHYLPSLDLFHKWVFVPELLTNRIKRGIKLYQNDEWKKLKEHKLSAV